MQYKVTLVVRALPDACGEDCAPWGDKYEEYIYSKDGELVPKTQCRNDAEWLIMSHKSSPLRKVCSEHIGTGMKSAYEEVASSFIISTFRQGEKYTPPMPREDKISAESISIGGPQSFREEVRTR